MAVLILNQGDVSDMRYGDLVRAAIFALSTILCCVLACIVPTRRALRIQPTEALKDEA
jgi:ABC-type lipoprotein release transport system permease subunit